MILIARAKQILDGLLAYVQYDFDSVPETETLLYHMFFGTKDGSFDFYEQAKTIFLRGNQSPRKIQTSLEFPMDKNHLPCIVVREPGRGEGEMRPFGGFGEAALDEFGNDPYRREGFSQSNRSSIQYLCFGGSTLESVLIGEVLFTLLVGARNTLEQEFIKFDFNAQDLIMENKLFPTPILMKTITIDVEEEGIYASIIRPEIVKRFVIEDAIPVGTDPNWQPPVLPPYFRFSRPYVWMDEMQQAQQHIFSNTDWKLILEDTNELFNFGKDLLTIDEATNAETQDIKAKVSWKLE